MHSPDTLLQSVRSTDSSGWTIEDTSAAHRSAVHERMFDDLRVFEYQLNSSRGVREACQGMPNYLGLAYIISGTETCRTADSCISIKPGDILTWDSQTSQHFEVPESVHKITFAVPDYRLSGTVQKRHCANMFIDHDCEVGALLSGYLKGFVSLLDRQISAASLEMTLDFVLRGLSMLGHGPTENVLLGRIFQYIEAHLHDPELSPQQIAEANCISLRYLQTLFAREQMTVAAQIWDRRLDRGRQLLASSPEHQKIFCVAFELGFKDVPHFNRAFKRKFGITPGAYRHRCFATGTGAQA